MGTFQKYKFVRSTFLNRPSCRSIGYARASLSLVEPELQEKNLRSHGCSSVFKEKVEHELLSKDFSNLGEALDALEDGDELVLTSVDRLGSTQLEIVNHLYFIQNRGIHIRTLDGLINTRSLGSIGKALIGLLSGLSSVEHALNKGKDHEKINQSRVKGRSLGGRPKTNPAKEGLVVRLRKEGFSYRSIREQTGLALSTIRRIILDNENTIG